MAASTHRARHHTITGLVESAGLAVVATIPLGVNRSSLMVYSGRRHVGRPACAKDARRIPSMALRGGTKPQLPMATLRVARCI